MSQLLDALKNYIVEHPVISSIVVIAVLSIIGTYLWRSGWTLGKLKRIKLGPVEAEKAESAQKGADSRSQPPTSHTSTRDISVQVSGSNFQKNVGDIGGIITKVNPAERKDD